MRCFLPVLALAALVVTLPAQSLTGKCSPNPATVGQPISLVLDTYEASSVVLASGCGLATVRQGSPTGPIIYQPFICPAVIIAIAPGPGNRPIVWPGTDNRGNAVAPGLYFIEVVGWNNASVQVRDFFPVRIDPATGPTAPTLTVNGTTGLGDMPILDITRPSQPGAIFVVAASLDTNVGQNIAGLSIALDNDFLFNQSFPVANPAYFSGFVGALDGTGFGQAVVTIPNIAGLAGFQLSLQAVVIGGTGLEVSNPTTCSMR